MVCKSVWTTHCWILENSYILSIFSKQKLEHWIQWFARWNNWLAKPVCVTLAALVPPPRIHRHRYYGVLAPNSPVRASVTSMAGLSLDHGAIEVQNSDHKEEETIEQEQEQVNKPKRPPNRYLWAMLLARIYNLFPLLCPECGTEMQVNNTVIFKICE